jgi:hypothetical protein
MYRKLYRASDETLPAVPMLVISDRRRRDTIIGLRGLGWGSVTALINTAPGSVTITETELRVEVHGAVMVRDRTANQPAPAGWCTAASAFEGRCLVVVVPAEIMGDEQRLVAALRDASANDTVAAALVPVSHLQG